MMKDVAAAILQNSDTSRVDSMEITLRTAFDLGIASHSTSYSEFRNIEDWVKLVQ
jgi:hypothetical protein